MARRFAQGGFSVALVSRKKESSQPVLEDIEKSGGKAFIVTADTGKTTTSCAHANLKGEIQVSTLADLRNFITKLVLDVLTCTAGCQAH